MVREYWTETRRSLVIEGKPDVILNIANALKLSSDVIVRVSNARSVIGLWGDSIGDYQRLVATNRQPLPAVVGVHSVAD